MATDKVGESRKATVTWLECRERPRQVSALPVNIHATLLRVPKMPLHFYRYLQWQIGHKYHWVYRLRMSDAELAALIHDPRTDIRVLFIDGAPAGMFELHQESEGETNLVYFGLMESAHGRGVGKWLLGQAVQTAWNMPITRLTVCTNTLDHPNALPLYQKMGFSPMSQSEAIVRPLTDAELLKAIKPTD